MMDKEEQNPNNDAATLASDNDDDDDDDEYRPGLVSISTTAAYFNTGNNLAHIRPFDDPTDDELQARINRLEADLIFFLATQRKWRIFLFIVMVLVVGITVGWTTLGTHGASVARPSPALPIPSMEPSVPPSFTAVPSIPPTTIQENEYVALIRSRFDDVDFSDPTSPQSKALDWILFDPFSARITNDRRVQRFALATIYFGTQGSDWNTNSSWLTPTTECGGWTRQNLLCNDETTNVESLNLSGNGLVGSIPPEIGILSHLTSLTLSRNALNKDLPTQMGLLTALTLLDISANCISGMIPSEVGALTNLNTWIMDDNSFTGDIPTTVGFMTSLVQLHFSFNLWWGVIPSEMGRLTELVHFDMSQNLVRGQLPTELGKLTSLTVLSLGGNDWYGTLPSELGGLTMAKMVDVAGHDGSIGMTGTIPWELANLVQATTLDVSDNRLTGTVPTELGRLTNLSKLRLFANYLLGTIPTEFVNLTNLDTLWLFKTDLTGTIPSELCSPGNSFVIDCRNIKCKCCYSRSSGYDMRRC